MEETNYDDDKESKVKVGTWKKILKTVLKNKKLVVFMIISVTVLAMLDISVTLLNSYALNTFFSENPDFSNDVLFLGTYVVVGLLYFASITGFLYFSGNLEIETSYELRKQAFDNLQRLPFSYFDKTPQGWIMARMTSDSRKLSNIISWGLMDFLWGLLTMFAILIILFIRNWRLALIILALLPVLFFISYLLRKKILKAYRSARKINSQITAAYNEGFMGIKTTKSLVIEEANKENFDSLAYRFRKSAVRAVLFSSLFGPVVYLIGYIGVSATLYRGSQMVIDGILTAGTLYLFIDYTVRFFDPVMQLARVISDFQNAQASAERVVQLIETESEIVDTEEVIEKYGTIFEPKKENFEKIKGEIDFKNVTFKYNNGETVLKNFNLHINQGQSVALVGHTGSGKSTIVNLICRFYEPVEGVIEIDGKNYKDRSITWLHSNLGYVLQSPQLFSASIKENIRYGKLDATDEEIINAAKVVNAHDFIMNMDKGYDTLVGEGGSRLSLGEKQLISFARAIIGDPSILILDEATSSIDTETEYLIQDTIDKLMVGRTTFVIAHRLSTVVNSDLILVLDKGEVIESGTHRELLDKKGYYFNLYKNQFIQEYEKKHDL